MSKKLNNVIVENARLIFRNFSGKAGTYNPEGQRNFCVVLPDNLADGMLRDGWNIKYLNPREEGDEPQPYIQVKVRYDNFPPHIVLVTAHGKSVLDESMIDTLDWAEIANADLVISPYQWEMAGGKTGVTAYCKTLYVTIAVDPFEAKYATPSAPDSAYDAVGGCGHCEECDGHCKGY